VDVFPENIGPRISSKYPFFLDLCDNIVDVDAVGGSDVGEGGDGGDSGDSGDGGDDDGEHELSRVNEVIVFVVIPIMLALFILIIIYIYLFNYIYSKKTY